MCLAVFVLDDQEYSEANLNALVRFVIDKRIQQKSIEFFLFFPLLRYQLSIPFFSHLGFHPPDHIIAQ